MTIEKNHNPTKLSSDPPSDEFCIRCPRLGHQINFPYCRAENNGLPCFKTLDCWYAFFDVYAHLSDTLSKEAFQKTFLSRAKPKISSLFDLIEQAKARKGKSD